MLRKQVCIVVCLFVLAFGITGHAQEYWEQPNLIQPVSSTSERTIKPASFWKRIGKRSGNQDAGSQLTDPKEVAGPDYEPLDEDESGDSESTQSRARTKAAVLTQWPSKSMANLRIDPRPTAGEIPSDQADRLIGQYVGNWGGNLSVSKGMIWEAPNIRYQPLYFEDVDLERYGHVVRNDLFQSAVSFAHFFSSAALLPFHMRHDPVYSCDYPLGYCRPGNCTNQIFQRSFWSRTQ